MTDPDDEPRESIIWETFDWADIATVVEGDLIGEDRRRIMRVALHRIVSDRAASERLATTTLL